jgi:hypothetical protein
MKLFEDSDAAETAERIRVVFRELGGDIPIRELAVAVRDRGLLTPDELERLTLRAIGELCKRACARLTDANVPWAQPTGKGKLARWRQLDLFTYPQFCELVGRRIEELDDDYQTLVQLYQWGLAKYGRAPEIPVLQTPTEA